MYHYTEEQIQSMKKVEATRAERLKNLFPRMTAEEKDEVLKQNHPDYIESAYENLKIGPNKGDKVLHELADLLQGEPRINEYKDKVHLDKPDYDVDVLVIGGGGAGSSAAIYAAPARGKVLVGDANRTGGRQLFKQIHQFFRFNIQRGGHRGNDI